MCLRIVAQIPLKCKLFQWCIINIIVAVKGRYPSLPMAVRGVLWAVAAWRVMLCPRSLRGERSATNLFGTRSLILMICWRVATFDQRNEICWYCLLFYFSVFFKTNNICTWLIFKFNINMNPPFKIHQ